LSEAPVTIVRGGLVTQAVGKCLVNRSVKQHMSEQWPIW